MKKLVAIVSTVLAAAGASAAQGDQQMARVNAALEAASKAAPAHSARLSQSQIAWASWADQDCKARIGAPAEAAITLNDPKYASCMADQFERRAAQLSQYACTSDNRYCTK